MDILIRRSTLSAPLSKVFDGLINSSNNLPKLTSKFRQMELRSIKFKKLNSTSKTGFSVTPFGGIRIYVRRLSSIYILAFLIAETIRKQKRKFNAIY